MGRLLKSALSREVLVWRCGGGCPVLGALFVLFILCQAYINRYVLLASPHVRKYVYVYADHHQVSIDISGSFDSAAAATMRRMTYKFEPKARTNLTDDVKAYFESRDGNMCFKIGGDWVNEPATGRQKQPGRRSAAVYNDTSVTTWHCRCKTGWWGEYCSFPIALQKDSGVTWRRIRPRITPRRVIYATPFNNEFDMADIRLHELYDVVDLFMFGESNYTSFGKRKELRLLNALNNGFARQYQRKILYVLLDHFDEKGFKDGWVAEALQRNHIGEQGLRYQVLGGQPEDLFILTDADEIPRKEMLLFLKNHDGFPEPFGFTLQPSVFTFCWGGPRLAQLYGGCTLAMVRNVLEYKVYYLRNPVGRILGDKYMKNRLKTHTVSAGRTTVVSAWMMGSGRQAIGWHCSSCFSPHDIKVKMISAQNGDFPRWGNFPEKMNETYIRTLIILGYWFDERTKIPERQIDYSQLPAYVAANKEKFKHLLNRTFYGKPAFSLPRKPEVVGSPHMTPSTGPP